MYHVKHWSHLPDTTQILMHVFFWKLLISDLISECSGVVGCSTWAWKLSLQGGWNFEVNEWPYMWSYYMHYLCTCVKCIILPYKGLPKSSENLLIITWILTLSPNLYCHLRSSHLGLVYNDPSDFAIFGSTHWSLPALACLVPVAILLGSLQWIWNAALSTRVSF